MHLLLNPSSAVIVIKRNCGSLHLSAPPRTRKRFSEWAFKREVIICLRWTIIGAWPLFCSVVDVRILEKLTNRTGLWLCTARRCKRWPNQTLVSAEATGDGNHFDKWRCSLMSRLYDNGNILDPEGNYSDIRSGACSGLLQQATGLTSLLYYCGLWVEYDNFSNRVEREYYRTK